MREPPDITEERLLACVEDQYAVVPASCEFLRLLASFAQTGSNLHAAQQARAHLRY